MRLPLATAILATALATYTHSLSFVPSTASRNSLLSPPSLLHRTRRQDDAAATAHRRLSMKDENNPPSSGGNKFSLANLFASDATAAATSALRGAASATKLLEPHPSKRNHINPLNALYPPNLKDLAEGRAGDLEGAPLPVHPQVKSGVLENGLSYVFLPNRSPPGRFETHLQVFSGSGA